MFTSLFDINGGDYFGSMEAQFESGDYSRGYKGEIGYDPNYYHTWFDVLSIVKETDAAIMVNMGPIAFWVPRKIIRDQKPGKIFAHSPTFTTIYKNAVLALQQDFAGLPNLDD